MNEDDFYRALQELTLAACEGGISVHDVIKLLYEEIDSFDPVDKISVLANTESRGRIAGLEEAAKIAETQIPVTFGPVWASQTNVGPTVIGWKTFTGPEAADAIRAGIAEIENEETSSVAPRI